MPRLESSQRPLRENVQSIGRRDVDPFGGSNLDVIERARRQLEERTSNFLGASWGEQSNRAETLHGHRFEVRFQRLLHSLIRGRPTNLERGPTSSIHQSHKVAVGKLEWSSLRPGVV